MVRSIDTITLPGRLIQSIKIECKGRLKVSLSGACRNICGQDQINSKLFFVMISLKMQEEHRLHIHLINQT